MESELPEADAAEKLLARTPPTPTGLRPPSARLDANKRSCHQGDSLSMLPLSLRIASLHESRTGSAPITRRIDARPGLKFLRFHAEKKAHSGDAISPDSVGTTKNDKDSPLGIVYKPWAIQEIFGSRLTG